MLLIASLVLTNMFVVLIQITIMAIKTKKNDSSEQLFFMLFKCL